MKTAFLGVSAQRSAQASRLSARKHVGATEFTRSRVGGSTASRAPEPQQTAAVLFLMVLQLDTPIGNQKIVLCLAPTAPPKPDGTGGFSSALNAMASY